MIKHIPVLADEVIEQLNLKKNQNIIDCTVGGGGHDEQILKKVGPRGKLFGLDADVLAIAGAKERLAKYVKKGRAILIQENFQNLQKTYDQFFPYPVDGILLDLGISSLQLDDAERGFSFQRKGPLDMRFDPVKQKLTAAHIIAKYKEEQLVKIFSEFGEERFSKRIAKAIVKERKITKITTTDQLAAVVKKSVPPAYRYGRINPATRVFQAVRIEVNQELEVLKKVLPQAIEVLIPGGRLVVISFHSLEDRIVKRFMQLESIGCICPKEFPICACGHQPRLTIVNKKIVTATEQEIKENPRSRSAKMRVAQKI